MGDPLGDKPLPEDAAIDAALPTLSGRHDLYTEAMRLVGAKQSKAALVDLVNWLLLRIDTAERERADAREHIRKLRGDALLVARDIRAEFSVMADEAAVRLALVHAEQLENVLLQSITDAPNLADKE